MSELEDIFRDSNAPVPVLYEGSFAETPPDVQSAALVLIPQIDSVHAQGPCPWAPRVLEDGSADMPTRGDLCLVAIAIADDEDNVNPWVVLWWPYP
jgi:hypothetical protein